MSKKLRLTRWKCRKDQTRCSGVPLARLSTGRQSKLDRHRLTWFGEKEMSLEVYFRKRTRRVETAPLIFRGWPLFQELAKNGFQPNANGLGELPLPYSWYQDFTPSQLRAQVWTIWRLHRWGSCVSRQLLLCLICAALCGYGTWAWA